MAEGGAQHMKQPIINLNVYLFRESGSMESIRVEKVVELPQNEAAKLQINHDELHGGNTHCGEASQATIMDAVLNALTKVRLKQAEDAQDEPVEQSITSLNQTLDIQADVKTSKDFHSLGLHGTSEPCQSELLPPLHTTNKEKGNYIERGRGKLPGRAVAISSDRRQNSVMTSAILKDLAQAETYLQEDERCIAMTVISNVTKRIMTSPNDAQNEIKMAAKKFQQLNPLRALILLRILSRVYLVSKSPNDAISRIRDDCLYKCCEIVIAIYKGVKGREMATEVGIPFVLEILDDVRGLEGCAVNLKSEKLAICLNDVGNTYRKIGKPQIGIEYATKGVDALKCHFGSTASKRRIFGVLHNTIGAANEDLGNYAEADDFFRLAITSRDCRSRFK